MVNKDVIEHIINNEGFNQNSNSAELKSHSSIGLPILNQTLDANDVLNDYLLGSHNLSKLKHIEPNQKIIDSYDIDWSGYQITIQGKTFRPRTTFEMLDLIFRLIKNIYDINGSEDVEWNDTGKMRISDNNLNWCFYETHDFEDKNSWTDNTSKVKDLSNKYWDNSNNVNNNS